MNKREILNQLKAASLNKKEISVDEVVANWGNNKPQNLMPIPNQISKTAYSIQHILENGIENFIEKGCIEACLQLWELNIFTFESSNNTSYSSAWIDLLSLSPENSQVLQELQAQGKAGINPYTNCNCLLAPVGPDAEQTFLESISKFHKQDIPKELYCSGEEFLESAKRSGGEVNILEDGTIERNPNPALQNLTLEEALVLQKKEHLYDKTSNRIFIDEYTYAQYQKYCEYLKESQSL